MNTATIEIKHVENSLEILNQFATELNLDCILAQEFQAGLASDISNAY
jgi:hypothetical protein